MLPSGSARKVTIYLNQDTRAHVEPLWSTILSFLRHKHVAGATLLRADVGFGSHEQFHDPRSEYAGEHLPVRIEFVDTLEHVDEILPNIYEMVTDGLVTVQDVTVVKSVSRMPGIKSANRNLPEKLLPRQRNSSVFTWESQTSAEMNASTKRLSKGCT